jgi:Phage portal protein, SPP1 Gp6-like
LKISPAKKSPEKIKMKTRVGADGTDGASMLAEWWKAKDDRELATQLCGTLSYLKTNQTYRLRQLAVDIRLYCGLAVYSYAGSTVAKMDRTKTLPDDKPTFNIISSCIDTLLSRLTQNEPEPKFLTDGADYKQRHLAQELNQFILGEFYQTHAYQKAAKMLRDGMTMGTGCLKVYRGDNDKVCIDRVMPTDLYVDDNDSLNGEPQQLLQMKLVDRDKIMANSSGKAKSIIAMTPKSYPDNAPDSGRTTADQIMLVEGWKLASGPDPEAPGYIPGRHTIATQEGIIFDEEWHKDKFPFVFFKYSEPFLGFWGQGIATRLFGTQLSINRIMYTIARAISLVGVPRVFIEQSSKVVKAHNNNEIGVIVTYSGTKPSYEVAPCNAPELYTERDKLIEYGFRQEGVSDLQATGKKPSGLDSGEAIRSYDDVNSDRSAETSKKYEQIFIDLAYLVTDVAMDIAEETGKYQTIYPNKDGTKEINLPQMGFLKNPFVIKCFTESSLPRTPAGRIATVTEQVQAGMLTVKEGRRLMKFPDLEQNEKLDNSSEERIFQILDKIVEDGKYTPPDPFIDLQLATTLTVQYINLYLAANLEEEKADLLRKFFTQVQTMVTAGQPPAPAPGPTPTANPQAAPTSPLVPNTNAPALAA